MHDTSPSLLEELRKQPSGHAWQRFVDLYGPLLHGWLRKQGLQHEDASDLTQDVLTVVLRMLPTFEYDPQRGHFRSWLRAIMMNRVRGFRRDRQRRPVVTGDSAFERLADQLADPHSEISQAWEREHQEFIARHVLVLVEADFEPVTWQVFRALTVESADPATIAERFGISVNAVYLVKFRVLRRVRQQLAGLMD